MNLIDLLQNQVVRYILILIVGIGIGAIFYPTKKIEEKVSQKYEQEITSLKEIHSKELQDITSRYASSLKENNQLKIETEKKISVLTSQISTLKSKQKTSHYKLIKPDGTIEERDFSENDIDQSTKTISKVQEEFKQKVDIIEQKWQKIHEERVSKMQKEFDNKESDYKKTISSYEMTKTTSINQKTFSLEGGMLGNYNYYAHLTTDLFGPIFLGLHSEIQSQYSKNAPSQYGIGVGMRF